MVVGGRVERAEDLDIVMSLVIYYGFKDKVVVGEGPVEFLQGEKDMWGQAP